MTGLLERLRAISGADWVRTDDDTRDVYGQDALKALHRPDVVVLPADTREIAQIATLCDETRTPIVPRGAGTGYSGGAVPLHGGVVLSLERLNRILDIDERSLLAVVQPNVITGVLQAAVELIDAASLEAVRAYVGTPLAPEGAGAVLLLEVDGGEAAVADEAVLVRRALAAAGATEIRRAADEVERDELWRLRRELSPSLKTIARLKLNH